jgi:hypothetical protein
MGYQGTYKVYAGKECLGTFAGWTADEAKEQAQKYNPKSVITSVKHVGENR